MKDPLPVVINFAARTWYIFGPGGAGLLMKLVAEVAPRFVHGPSKLLTER